MNKIIYTAIQYTWGLPQTLAGAALSRIHHNDEKFNYRNARVTLWDRDDGISLGKFIFIPKRNAGVANSSEKKDPEHGGETVGKGVLKSAGHNDLLVHEYGHTIQSLMLGPAYLMVIGLPSMLWNRLPYFRKKRKATGRSYYSVWFEKTATSLGSKSTGNKTAKKY